MKALGLIISLNPYRGRRVSIVGVKGRRRRAPAIEPESRRVGVEGLCRQGERLVEVLGETVRVMA